MSKSMKWLVGVLIAITAASVISVVFMLAHRVDTDEEDEQAAVKTPSRVSTQEGHAILTLDLQAQTRQGIRVSAIAEKSTRAQLRGTAVLISASDLANLRNNYVAARTKVERDQVDLSTSRSQYERTKLLYEQNENMSLKAMQDAEATYRNTQAQANADDQDAKLQLGAIRQRWGAGIANWVEGNSPALQAVLEQRDFLAQVTFPPGEVASPPATLSLNLPGNQFAQARFLSSFPQVNPQIQGLSFLYLLPNRPGLAVGMNLVALLPVGQLLKGVVVPQSAIVWWQGKAWVYEALSPKTFTRREVPTSNSIPDGYFAPNGTLAAQARIVTEGAQSLLSEEFRSQIQQED